MAESLEEMFVATKYVRRRNIPEAGLFTTDGDAIYRLVSQNGDANQITVRGLSLNGGNLSEGTEEQLYKYGDMVYLVEEGSDEDEDEE